MKITQHSVLRQLEIEGSQPLSRLAEHLIVERTTLYRALEPMERKGWLKVDTGPSGRSKTAAITDLGRLALCDAEEGWTAAQGMLAKLIDHQTLAKLEVTLEELGMAS